MPKVGMEHVRKSALLDAAITEIGALGSLDVTVRDIARRAGVSPALAHHYFGGKVDIQTAAMRKMLFDFGKEVRRELSDASCAQTRVQAILNASFSQACFAPEVVTAWMAFYGHAQSHEKTLRLLTVYHRRLHSNLCFALRPICHDSEDAAHILAAFIDGVYLRAALTKQVETPVEQGMRLFYALSQHTLMTKRET